MTARDSSGPSVRLTRGRAGPTANGPPPSRSVSRTPTVARASSAGPAWAKGRATGSPPIRSITPRAVGSTRTRWPRIVWSWATGRPRGGATSDPGTEKPSRENCGASDTRSPSSSATSTAAASGRGRKYPDRNESHVARDRGGDGAGGRPGGWVAPVGIAGLIQTIEPVAETNGSIGASPHLAPSRSISLHEGPFMTGCGEARRQCSRRQGAPHEVDSTHGGRPGLQHSLVGEGHTARLTPSLRAHATTSR